MAATYNLRTDLVWPADLELPGRPPAIVYMDMFPYINLADYAAGRNNPAGYDVLLPAARRARSEGRAIFPLSTSHVVELCDVGDVSNSSTATCGVGPNGNRPALFTKTSTWPARFVAAAANVRTLSM
ncbi:MAG: hypothetical protein JWR37_5501 [Mycobacterium sp.]|nr:hypothetical protein [Mycobacterium sp.]